MTSYPVVPAFFWESGRKLIVNRIGYSDETACGKLVFGRALITISPRPVVILPIDVRCLAGVRQKLDFSLVAITGTCAPVTFDVVPSRLSLDLS